MGDSVSMAKRCSRGGFTLLEIMIVVALMAIVMAMALPNLVNARKAANESRVIAFCKTVCTASEQYRNRYGSYPDDELDLLDSGLIPNYGGSAWFSAYAFQYVGNVDSWYLSASPALPGQTGDRWFYVDDSGVIRYSETGPATSASLPVD